MQAMIMIMYDHDMLKPDDKIAGLAHNLLTYR